MLWLYILIIVICMVCSALCSAADLVYGVVDQDKLEKEANKGDKKAARALKIARDYELSISTILFGNNVVNVTASAFLALISMNWLSWQEFLLTAGFTLALIVFCEFIPKAIAKRFNYKLAKSFVIPVTILKYSPTIVVVWPISKLFKLIVKLFQRRSKEEDEIDEDVLTEMVNAIEEEGMLEEGEAELVRSAIDLNDIQAYEIMTPRVDVFSINVEDDINEIMEDEEIFKHSRIPVYEETIDNIIGILPLKSLLKARLNGGTIDIRELLYKPVFIPRNRQVLDLLSEFKTSKIHIAVIVDEYGGAEGIVTMEDILEEIVGEIFDETDEIEELYVSEKDGSLVVDGSMNLDDFFELIEYKDEYETDYTTVGGLCQELLDRFAVIGDKVKFNDYTLEVLEADEFTAEKIRVTKIEEDIENSELGLTVEEETVEEQKEEEERAKSLVDLTDFQAFEIMTPRVDMFAINIEDDINEIIKNGEAFKYGQIPVYEETIDNIIGFLSRESLISIATSKKRVDIKKYLTEPVFIPRNSQVFDLLAQFNKDEIKLAVVVDEYGGTEGIFTISDILKEVVDEIVNKNDENQEEVQTSEDGVLYVDGSMNLDDFFELINYKDEFETDYTTIAGLCQEVLDRFAKVGDTFDFGGYSFEVLEADEFTVEKLKVVKKIDDEAEEK